MCAVQYKFDNAATYRVLLVGATVNGFHGVARPRYKACPPMLPLKILLRGTGAQVATGDNGGDGSDSDNSNLDSSSRYSSSAVK